MMTLNFEHNFPFLDFHIIFQISLAKLHSHQHQTRAHTREALQFFSIVEQGI